MSTIAKPPIADLDSWLEANQRQLDAEDDLFEQIRAVAASRRRLPMTPLQHDYTFTGPDGEVPIADVFVDARQLVVYHFMFAPEWERGCPHCTEYATNQGHSINKELNRRDTRYVLVSRAPYEKLVAWAAEKGIATPWYSVSTQFATDMGQILEGFGDAPGISVFFKDADGTVYRTYHTSGRQVESTMPASGMLRMTPYGMQEYGEDSPEGWPQRFDAM